uniref:Uncharacterized protein n=1 Tax=Moniliophthora roreri TaxID=221103 RepID=A0A0W0GCE7_MONRR
MPSLLSPLHTLYDGPRKKDAPLHIATTWHPRGRYLSSPRRTPSNARTAIPAVLNFLLRDQWLKIEDQKEESSSREERDAPSYCCHRDCKLVSISMGARVVAVSAHHGRMPSFNIISSEICTQKMGESENGYVCSYSSHFAGEDVSASRSKSGDRTGVAGTPM